jgi:hypothetical protein
MKVALFSLAVGCAISGAAHGATVVFSPTVDVTSTTLVHQGPNVAFSQVHNVNGVVQYNSSGPGGSTSTTPIGAGATNVSASTYQPGSTNGGVPLSASSFGQADLATGTLRASVSASGPDNFGTPGGDVTTWLADTVHFNNTSGGDLQLHLSYSFDGLFTSPVSGQSSSGFTFLQLTGCGACNNITFAADGRGMGDVIQAQFNEGGIYAIDSYYGPVPVGGAGHWFASIGGPGIVGTVATDILIPTGVSELGVKTYLNVSCRSGDSCDFAHTGTFGFGALPTGLSFTSESGVFLSGVTAGVPEPATWAMMIGGLGLAGLALRARRRRELASA